MNEHARIQFELAKATSREEVLGLALGAASSCWEDMSAAGEFDSHQAKLILQDTLERLAELDATANELAGFDDLGDDDE